MSYNLSGLTKKSEGQIVRGGALKAKSDLEFKLTGLEREKAGLSGTAGSITVELQSAELKAQLQQNYVSQLSRLKYSLTSSSIWKAFNSPLKNSKSGSAQRARSRFWNWKLILTTFSTALPTTAS